MSKTVRKTDPALADTEPPSAIVPHSTRRPPAEERRDLEVARWLAGADPYSSFSVPSART